MQATGIARWRAAIGPNADRYLRVFDRIERGGSRWVAGWNWAAFLYSTGWFFYRRLFGYALLNFLGSVIFMLALVTAPNPLSDVVIVTYVVLAYVLLPMDADAIYHRKLRKALARAADQADEPAGSAPEQTDAPADAAPALAGDRHVRTTVRPPRGWTWLGGLALALLGLFVVLAFISQYVGYAPRDKVNQGIAAGAGVAAQVEEFYYRESRLPNETEAAQFNIDTRESRYATVKSVRYDSTTQRVIVTMADQQFRDQQVAIRLLLRDGALMRKCETIDLPAKYLPASCR